MNMTLSRVLSNLQWEHGICRLSRAMHPDIQRITICKGHKVFSFYIGRHEGATLPFVPGAKDKKNDLHV